MKRLFHLLTLLAIGLAVGCSEAYDDSALRGEIDELKERIEDVETLLNASANNLVITSVSETDKGYVVTFSDGSTISVNHGKDGENGKDGKDGKDGQDGNDGENGKDGQNGQNGQDGKDGETLIESISIGESDVTFVLTSGKTVVVPLEGYYDQSEAPIHFLDNTTKVLCVLAWDSDGDQQLSYKEAAAVTDIGATFRESSIMAFRELRFFTSLTAIPSYAFYGCNKLIALTLPEGVLSIGEGAFRNCSSLQELDIPEGVATLGESTFQGCTNLARVSIPSSVEKIPYYCFYQCEKLTEVAIAEGVKTIGERAFQSCYALPSVVIPQSVEQIERNAFYFCEGLESVSLPAGLTAISNETFYNCESLKSVTMPAELTAIGNYAFRNCTALSEVVMNDKVEKIGDYAFKNCTSLQEIVIPDSVTEVGGWSFEDCTSLVAVYCYPVEPPLLSYDAFDHNGANRIIYVPSESVESYKTAKVWSDYVLSIEAQAVK